MRGGAFLGVLHGKHLILVIHAVNYVEDINFIESALSRECLVIPLAGNLNTYIYERWMVSGLPL